MSGDRPMSFRFTIALVLSIVGLAVPAWADFEAGEAAFHRGDYATALREWRPLAEQGDVMAQTNLGVLYVTGRGVPQDYDEARQWWEKAAAQGNAGAQHNLGRLYSEGRGVFQYIVQAHMWFNLSAANGGKDAAMFRERLARKMTPAQIDEAQKLPREWKPKTL